MSKKILFVGSEMVPFASTGGLGDVIGSLPEALKNADKDIDVRVILPLYGTINDKYRNEMTHVADFNATLSWRNLYCGIYKLEKNGVTIYFIDNEYYFKRPSLYGNYDDGEIFAYFSMAVLQALPLLDFIPDVLHAHDWQSALTVVYLKTIFAESELYKDIKTVFTIHNVAYQGNYDMAVLGDVFALDEKYSSLVEYDGRINLMKGAIQLSDVVSTVSPTYANELKYPEYSHGMHYILNENDYKLCGILNGIDYEYYNPKIDSDLYSKYSINNVFTGKMKNKEMLFSEYLPEGDAQKPLLSIITRLAGHKGIDIIIPIIKDVLDYSDASLFVLGTGEVQYEEFFKNLENEYKGRVKTVLAFDKALSKKIYASSDIFLMPSKTEPCGLAQMIASRYGTVPITRETGGLYDSIKPYYVYQNEAYGNGFTFKNYCAEELKDRIFAALQLYNNTKQWRKLVKKAMTQDFCWNVSAEKYLEMYDNL